MPKQHAGIVRRKGLCVDVSHFSKHWPLPVSSARPGRKHNRPIRLEAIVYEGTEERVRGLINSDGCRVVANDRGVMSIRYRFSNRSEDIIGLFTAAVDHLEIPWTRSTRSWGRSREPPA
jgi:hypothetical protein